MSSRNHITAARLEELADASEKLARHKNRTDLVGEIYEECRHRAKTCAGSRYPAVQLVNFAMMTVLDRERKAARKEASGILDTYDDAHHSIDAKLPEYFVPPDYLTPQDVQQATRDANRIQWQRQQIRKKRKRGIVDPPNEGHRYNGARTAYRDGRRLEHFSHIHVHAVHSWSSRNGHFIEHAL